MLLNKFPFASRIASALFCYAEPPPKEPGNGVLEAGNFTAEDTVSEDDVPPDFGGLDKEEPIPAVKPVTEPPPAAPVEPVTPPVTPKEPVTPPAAPTPPVERKRGPDGKFLKEGDDEPFPEIEAMKPGAKGKPAVDPSAPPAKAPEVKPPAAAAKPAEPAVKPPVPPLEGQVKPGEAPPAPKPLPKDDADIDGMQPKPTASEKTQNDFKALKTIAKEARAEARRVAAEAEELRAKVGTTELPADVKEKLARLDEAEKFKQMFELENEPRARAEYTAKLTAAEDKILAKLQTDPRLKLPQADADWLKKVGFDHPEAVAKRNGWFKAIREKLGDEMLVQEVAGLFRDREGVIQGRAAEVEKLRGDRDAFLKERQEHESGEFKRWGTTADQTLVELAKGHDWTDFMKEPDNATPEQKAVVEAHNKRVQEEIVPAFNSAVLDVFNRKPDVTVQHVFNSMRLKFEVEPELATLKTALAEKEARIAELEQLAQGVRRISQPSQAEAAPVKAAPAVAVENIAGAKEVSSDDAFDAWRAARG